MPIRILKTPEPNIPPADRVWLYVDVNDSILKQKNPDSSIRIYAGSTQFKTETVTLTAQMISEKKLTLAHTPLDQNGVVLIPAGGIAQLPGIDFFVDDNELSWNGLGLDGTLEANDIVLIYYTWS